MLARILNVSICVGMGVVFVVVIGAAKPAEAAAPDPTVVSAEIRTERDVEGLRHGRLVAVLKNMGDAGYRSAWNQQEIQVYVTETSEASTRTRTTLLQRIPFRDLAIGGEIPIERRISWRVPTATAGGDVRILRKWQTYTVRIVYDLDIATDGNASNDDRSLRNNVATATVEVKP